ncbi:MAG TPA: dinitrogenase iron-molybdenum cofactor biosynthesis protein [Dehalococcoidia bacterium]|nr:dinitrogenase iron-molybdenum cofactor biosynthesis protein [Dehalococcoidia bacterium]
MKIAVSAVEPGLEAEMDQRFGRCRYFTIVDTDTLECESIDNESSMSPGGAGTMAGQILSGKNVEAVLTGNCGPNAFNVLNTAGIEVYTGIFGKVKDAVERYKNGELQKNVQASVPDHFGSGGRRGRGRGMGMR